MSCWTKEELERMLGDVVDALGLSDAMVEKHGPLGTPPAELVGLVLQQKDMEIRVLKHGFHSIPGISRQARIIAIGSVIEAMKAANRSREEQGLSPAYPEEAFMDKADELMALAEEPGG